MNRYDEVGCHVRRVYPRRRSDSPRLPASRLLTPVLLAGALSGCQALSSPTPVDPQGGNALPAACTWQAQGDRLARLRVTRDVLEARGYAILDTDATLGVVSAERRTTQPGLGAVNSPFGRTGLWGGVGFGGRNGYSIGLSQGFGGAYNTDPVQIERLSVATPDTTTYLGRDSVVVDRNGYLIDARSYNHAGLCEEVRREIETRLTSPAPVDAISGAADRAATDTRGVSP